MPKGNFWILRIGLMGSLSSLQKSEFLKLIISFFHYFWCQNWDQWHKMSGKNTHIYFFYFWFKNKWVWAEKIGKKRKNSKNLKVAGNYPNSLVIQLFYMKNQDNQLKNSDFSKLLRPQVNPIFKIQKNPFGMLILRQKSF